MSYLCGWFGAVVRTPFIERDELAFTKGTTDGFMGEMQREVWFQRWRPAQTDDGGFFSGKILYSGRLGSNCSFLEYSWAKNKRCVGHRFKSWSNRLARQCPKFENRC